MTQVRRTEQAVGDLRSIREFIERDSPWYGRMVAERIFDSTARLESFPRSGRVVPEVGRDDLSEIIVGDGRAHNKLPWPHELSLTKRASIVSVLR